MDGWKICRTIDLQKNSPPIERLRVLATLSDRQAHHLEITVMDGDMPADLKGLLPWMSIILPGRMSLKKQAGEVKANVISVHLPRTCYAETGDVSVIVSLADESVQMQIPIYGCVLRVAADGTDTVIDEESVIPSISELLMQIDQMKSATREAVRAAERADHAVDGIDRKIFGATLPKVDIEYGKNLINLNGNGKSGIYAFYPSGYCIESAEYRAIAIPVKGGEKVSFNQVFTNAHVVALSAIPDMTAVSAGDTLTGYIEGFANEARQGYVIPQSCKCLVVSIPINSASAAQCEYGEVSTAYSPYVEGINASKIIGGVLFVGDGYPYATIKDACDAAHDGDTIYIMPGTYKESVICYDKEVRIKGHSRDSVILTNDSGNYFTPPLYIAKGAVEDLTIAEIALEKDESAIAPAYCVHADSDLQEGHSLTFKNVCFTNKFAACVGIGLRSNFKISFQNCEFVSDEGYAVYLHESQYNGSRNQYAEFVDCVMQSTQAAHAICMQETPTVTESEALVRFQRCIVKSASNEAITMVQYGTQPGLTGSGYLGSSVWKLDALSADNSASEMNALVFADVSKKADKVSGATDGNFAALDENGNLKDSGKNANDFAAVGEIDALKKSKAEIDDTAIDGDTWSSKHIVDMLCPKVEKSGTLVQMDGMLGGYPLGVTVSWTPAQEGSGDPSPENIRPIKGRTEVKVERYGENLLDIHQYFPVGYKKTTNGVTAEVLTDGRVHVYGKHTESGYTNVIHAIAKDFDKKRVFPQGTYSTGAQFTVAFNKNGSWDNRSGTFSLEYSSSIIGFFISVFGQKTFDFYVFPMLVAGAKVPTTYLEYIMDIHPLTLPSTVYGGEVDAEGKGQETWKTLTLDGTEEWKLVNRYCETVYRDLGIPSSTNDITSAKLSQHADRYIIDNPYANALADKCAWVYSSITYPYANLRIRHEAEQSTLENWKAYLAAQYAAGTPVQICYKLAEPVPFTSTGGTAISALSGINTVLTDADSVTATGRADPIQTIAKLSDRIAALEAAATNITE